MKNWSTIRFLFLPIFFACVLSASPMRSLGQDQQLSDNVGVSGERDFRMYCANCHGEDGRGDGPKTYTLSKLPPDLTKLSARNNHSFPRERIARIIDGREDIEAHGDRDMPAWGDWFKMEAEDGLGGAEGDEGTVKRRIDNLIDLLETMQGQ